MAAFLGQGATISWNGDNIGQVLSIDGPNMERAMIDTTNLSTSQNKLCVRNGNGARTLEGGVQRGQGTIFPHVGLLGSPPGVELFPHELTGVGSQDIGPNISQRNRLWPQSRSQL